MTIVLQIIEISQAVLDSFAIVSILLYCCINESTFVKIGNCLIHLECALCRLKQPLYWKHISHVLFLAYLFNFSLFVSVFVTDIISLNSPVSSFGYILPVIFVSFCFTQYFSALSLTNAISININCAIQDFCRSKFGDITLNTLFETRHVFVSYSKIHLVVRIRDVHGQLCDIISEISRFYSLPILITLSLISYILLYNVYYLFETITIQNVGVDYMIIVYTLLWIISMLYPLGLLTSKATKVRNEVEKTENLVHTLLNCTIDRQTKVELKQFSLQLLHRKIKSTANQYFTLNNTPFNRYWVQ